MSAEQKNPTVLKYHLSDGTCIEIRQCNPLTEDEAHLESCRWAERLEILLPKGDLFGEATLRAA